MDVRLTKEFSPEAGTWPAHELAPVPDPHTGFPRRPRYASLPAGTVCELIGNWREEFPDPGESAQAFNDWVRLHATVDGVTFIIAVGPDDFEPVS